MSLGLIGSIASGVIGLFGAKSAADAQEKGARSASRVQDRASIRSLNFQRQTFNLIRKDLAPSRAIGTAALKELFAARGELTRPFTMADFEADPGFEFRREQGEQAIERSLGPIEDSGRAIKGALRFNQGLASQEFGNAFNRFQVGQGNRFNRLARLAGIGESSIAQGNAAAAQFGQGAANTAIGAGNAAAGGILNAANARAGGTINATNALTGAISSGINNQILLNALRPSGAGVPINPGIPSGGI